MRVARRPRPSAPDSPAGRQRPPSGGTPRRGHGGVRSHPSARQSELPGDRVPDARVFGASVGRCGVSAERAHRHMRCGVTGAKIGRSGPVSSHPGRRGGLEPGRRAWRCARRGAPMSGAAPPAPTKLFGLSDLPFLVRLVIRPPVPGAPVGPSRVRFWSRERRQPLGVVVGQRICGASGTQAPDGVAPRNRDCVDCRDGRRRTGREMDPWRRHR